jgi:hypothetical protein
MRAFREYKGPMTGSFLRYKFQQNGNPVFNPTDRYKITFNLSKLSSEFIGRLHLMPSTGSEGFWL